MNNNRHPVTGCRHHSLYGEWAILEQPFEEMKARAYQEIEAGRLAAVAEESRRVTDEQGKALLSIEDGIARISIEGPITKYDTSFISLFGGTSTVRTIRAIREAVNDPSVKCLLLEVNSPGGTVLGVAELSDAVAKADAAKPVVGHVAGAACSAALWAILGCRQIVADPTAEIGSIGAFTVLTDRTENLARQGIKKEVITSGDIKGANADGVSLTDKQRAAMQQRIDDLADTFTLAVADARGMTPKRAREVADGGRVYGAKRAMELGLIDRIAYADDLITDLKQKPLPERRGAGRGKDKAASNGGASPRSSLMFNAEQLKQLRTLPGAAQVTEETAPQWILDFSTKASADLTGSTAKIQQLEGQIVTKDREWATLKAANAPAIDPKLAAGYVNLAVREVGQFAKEGLCTPAQAKLLTDAINPEGKPSAAAVSALGTVSYSAEVVHKVLEANKPLARGEQSPAQILDRTVPGTEAGGNTQANDNVLLKTAEAMYGKKV